MVAFAVFEKVVTFRWYIFFRAKIKPKTAALLQYVRPLFLFKLTFRMSSDMKKIVRSAIGCRFDDDLVNILYYLNLN